MARFHHAMASNALLFLGTAETIAGSDKLFLQDQAKSHVFRKRAVNKPGHRSYVMSNVPRFSARKALQIEAERADTTDSQMLAELIKSLGPKSILAVEDGNIVQVHGNISPYIEVTGNSG